MKTSALLALIGNFALLGDSWAPLGEPFYTSLMWIGLAGLAFLTMRSERLRTPDQPVR